MGDAKPGIVMANRDRELLIPVAHFGEHDDVTLKPSSSSHHSGHEKLDIKEVHDSMAEDEWGLPAVPRASLRG